MALNAKQRKLTRANIRNWMYHYKQSHSGLTQKQLQNATIEHFRGQYALDPETWKVILEIILKLLPLIMALFA